MKQIRFAPLIRVSSEREDSQSESLMTQKKQIIQYVKNLDGLIPESCWKYSGREHATPGYERKKLNELLADSSKDIFDAVIICDASRWSRDNRKSKAGLEIFRENGTRFFAGTTEFDLFDPQARLFLGMAAEMNEFFALEQSKKSLQNRIERAKRNIPTSGKLPYGRLYDKQSGQWSLDEEKAKNIKWAAGRYLKGQSIQKLATALNINHVNLWKVLTKRSGDKWECRFRSKILKIDETISITIPRLLSQKTIKRIHERAEINRTYHHGHIKHKYLLSRMVFCGHCGYAMFGQTNHNEKRYYRHPRGRKIKCDTSFWVRADDLENAVIEQLFNMYGDIESMEKSMTRAIPDNKKIEKLRKDKLALEKLLKKTGKRRERLVESISKGILSDSEAANRMQKIREEEILLKDEIEKIRPQVENVPTEAVIKRKSKLIIRTLEAILFQPGHLKKMTFKNKRALAEFVFGGKDAEGNRCGVYVRKGKPVSFEIRGRLQMPDVRKRLQSPDVLERTLFSKRHAHHGFCLYQRR